MKAKNENLSDELNTQNDKEKFAENAKNVRTDKRNLRFNEERQMYFFLPKDHPEYKEEESKNWCSIL